jgi:hypothetical protein
LGRRCSIRELKKKHFFLKMRKMENQNERKAGFKLD